MFAETLRRKTTGSLAIRYARWRMRNSGLFELLRHRPADAISAQSQAYDLWLLYREVRERKPRNILEFGTGASTVVMAEALARNGSGHLYSVDASERWLEESRKGLPERLNAFVTLFHSPLRKEIISQTPCSFYQRLPDDMVPDFVYLDGPAPADVPDWPKGAPVCAADLLHFEDKLAPGFFMIVDARLANVRFLRAHLARLYRVRYNEMFKITTFEMLR